MTRTQDGIQRELAGVAREYARLDGYDVMLRGMDSLKQEGALGGTQALDRPGTRSMPNIPIGKTQMAPSRVSHDEQANPRPDYLAGLQLYDAKDKLTEGLLDPDCIEARAWNLSASQYKPFNFEAVVSDGNVVQTIRDLKQKEGEIIQGLDRLLAMVDGS